MAHSNIEFASLELQRFWGVSKTDRDKLRAKFGGGGVVAARVRRHLALSARWLGGLKPSSPLLAGACVGGETAIAFAGEK